MSRFGAAGSVQIQDWFVAMISDTPSRIELQPMVHSVLTAGQRHKGCGTASLAPCRSDGFKTGRLR